MRCARKRQMTMKMTKVERARELLEQVSAALAAPKTKGNLLEDIAWSRDVEEAFFASGCTKEPEPVYTVDRDALDDQSKRLEQVARGIDGDEPIPTYLRATVLSAVDRNRLVGAGRIRRLANLLRISVPGATPSATAPSSTSLLIGA